MRLLETGSISCGTRQFAIYFHRLGILHEANSRRARARGITYPSAVTANDDYGSRRVMTVKIIVVITIN